MKLKMFAIVSGISCFSFSLISFADCPNPDDIQAWIDSDNGPTGDTAVYTDSVTGTSWKAMASGNSLDAHKRKNLQFNKQAVIMCAQNKCMLDSTVPNATTIECTYYGYNADKTTQMQNGLLVLIDSRSFPFKTTLIDAGKQWNLITNPSQTYLQCTQATVSGCKFLADPQSTKQQKTQK